METEIQDVNKIDMDFYHVYQPIFNLAEETVFGYEVLLRSDDFPNPESFFEHAKKNDLLFELDMNSIYQACKSEFSFFSGGLLFINIFPSTIIHPEFIPKMRKMEEDLKIKPSSVVFEIIEAEKKADFQLFRDVIAELRKQGYLIALDDIGKGDSTLQSIIELEPDIIKFERRFTRTITKSVRKQKYMEKIVQVFGEGISIVLEGLETKEELRVATSLGIPLVQGFYLGRPKSIDYYRDI